MFPLFAQAERGIKGVSTCGKRSREGDKGGEYMWKKKQRGG
jgi:hypothetical protein